MGKTFWSATRNNVELSVNQANIVREEVECIVNAANEHLAHGGGVAGAISSAAGSGFDRESRDYVRANGIVKTGAACITGSGRLQESAGIQKVIHAVGPVWYNGQRNEEYLLYSTVRASLLLADREGISSISIPAISSGIFGFPKPRCAEIMLAAGLQFIDENPETCVKKIRYSNFDSFTVNIFQNTAENEKFHKYYLKYIPADQKKERAKKAQTTAGGILSRSSDDDGEEEKKNESESESGATDSGVETESLASSTAVAGDSEEKKDVVEEKKDTSEEVNGSQKPNDVVVEEVAKSETEDKEADK